MKNVLRTLLFVLCLPGVGSSAESTTVTGDISRGLQHLKDESVEMVSVPFTPKDVNLLVTLGVIGATALTYGYDTHISEKLDSTGSKELDRATDAGSLAGNPFVHLGIAGLVYGFGFATDSPKLTSTGMMAAEALVLADFSTLLLKEAVGRGRPSVTEHKDRFKPFGFSKDYDSFPSMHTASSFALASVLSSTSESITATTLYYAAATFVGFSRMYQHKHWASDVIFGAALGELCGRIVTNYHASGRKWTVVPAAYAQGGGITMVAQW